MGRERKELETHRKWTIRKLTRTRKNENTDKRLPLERKENREKGLN